MVIYRATDGRVSLDVRLEKESIWLSLNQMAALFDRDKSVISRHLRSIFTHGELNRKSVVAFYATTAADGKQYQVEYYNLDAIISVGYRVNSMRGTQFRIWATGVLRDHLLKGYTINKRRLDELRQSVRLARQVLDRHDVGVEGARALLKVIADYEPALDIIDGYDHGRVPAADLSESKAVGIDHHEARGIIDRLRKKYGASTLFGREKDKSLHGSAAATSIPRSRRRRPTCSTCW